MRQRVSALSRYRIKTGAFASKDEHGPVGAFMIPCKDIYFHSNFTYEYLQVIAHDGKTDVLGEDAANTEWEHVSVTVKSQKDESYSRIPRWEEMAFIKQVFWTEDETVMQLHPSEDNYVNAGEHILHLWRPIKDAIPTPPTDLVGPKSSTDIKPIL